MFSACSASQLRTVRKRGDGDVGVASENVIAFGAGAGNEERGGFGPVRTEGGPVGVDLIWYGDDEQGHQERENVTARFHRVTSLTSPMTNMPKSRVKSAWCPENSSPEMCDTGGTAGGTVRLCEPPEGT